ncbi:MAG: alpha/beta fold hydrolase [Trichloromonadaceae bacterium]
MNSLILADGRRLAYRESGSGPALVLLHGWAMSSVVFSELSAELSRDFRLLAADLRGHGGSDPGPGYGCLGFAADLSEWFTHLDLRDAVLLGWSLGGEVALTLAAEAPLRSRLRALVLVATTPRFCAGDDWTAGLPATQLRALVRDLRRNYLKTMGDFFALQFVGETLSQERYQEILRFAVRAGRLPEPEIALAGLETLGEEDLRHLLPQLQLPTLVVHGELDSIVLPEAGRFLAASLPQARLDLWPQVGHAPFISDPLRFCSLLRSFLA